METVLIVDDERFFLTILKDLVSQELHMRPVTAEDGATALALLQREQVDLVLLDILMPGMDGLEVLRRIKQQRPTLPVIIVTASDAVDNTVNALREGADDFFRKPVDLNDLTLCVTRVLGKARPAASSAPPLQDSEQTRRRAPRARIEQRQPALLRLDEVYLLDMSLSGVLIEHTEPLDLGDIFRLSFPVEGQEVQVLARAVRAFARGYMTMPDGERRFVYNTGMEFVGVEKAVSNAISLYLDRLAQQDPGRMASPEGAS